jgi:membrane complex biogenesis BtpA family protein
MPFPFLAGKTKAVIAMAHIGALPGAPLYDPAGGIDALVEHTLADIRALQEGGVDAILFGNENDRPYVLKAPPEGIAGMTAVVTALKPHLTVPFGIDYLWDPAASVAIAAATGAAFVRGIMTGVFASDFGLWAPDAAGAARLRTALGRPDLPLMFNVNAEFAHPLDQRPIGLKARSAVFSSLADAVLVSGALTGEAVASADLRAVAEAVTDVPVLANTGVNLDNVRDVFTHASGCIIGTHLKRDGHTWNAVDPARVRRFMDTVETLR